MVMPQVLNRKIQYRRSPAAPAALADFRVLVLAPSQLSIGADGATLGVMVAEPTGKEGSDGVRLTMMP